MNGILKLAVMGKAFIGICFNDYLVLDTHFSLWGMIKENIMNPPTIANRKNQEKKQQDDDCCIEQNVSNLHSYAQNSLKKTSFYACQ